MNQATLPTSASIERPGEILVYSRLLEPAEHPDYRRRAVQPPSWAAFGGTTQFTCLRAFEVKDDVIVGYAEEIEKHTRHALGTVIWPSYPILFAKNLGDLADEIGRRNLYLFDIWGYVPGSGPGGYWRQFKAPREQLALLERKLGERWLGTDIGEQDGRYLNGYAAQMTPASVSRCEQYLNFQRHFERMGDDLGHRHATLVSLNFGHYLLKEGTYTLIGAETGQALPNNQVYYAFIRGAGKQYGVPWFGNASVWNRWGFKSYAAPGIADGFAFGPTKGTSLSLLKRLLYSHLLYNGMLAGFEANWFEADQLTPIGRIQQAAVNWMTRYGPPGAMHTPVALMVDFYSGWSFPRHLYTERVYRVWGNLPYGPGDYLTEAILDLVYPAYQASSYFHDETGFNVATPFGDIVDCLLSDVETWLLRRYPVVVLAGKFAGGIELKEKLEDYLHAGGHLVMTAGNLTAFPGGIADVVSVDADLDRSVGKGTLTVFAGAFGVKPVFPTPSISNETDRALNRPYVLEDNVRSKLAAIFTRQRLFSVGNESLSFITCRRAPGEYTVGVANNSWAEQSFQLSSCGGDLISVSELTIDDAEKSAPGYLPEGLEHLKIGVSGPDSIAGGDVRIFRLQVAEKFVRELPHQISAPRPVRRWLTLRGISSIKEAILLRPTFFEHFAGVVVDWNYLRERELKVHFAAAGWIARQKLRIAVDLSSGVNFYPGLRLVDNQLEDYAASMAAIDDILEKMDALGARDLITSLHRAPENNFTPAQATQALQQTLRTVAIKAAAHGVTLHLRATFEKAGQQLDDLIEFVDAIGLPNLKVAPAISVLARSREVTPEFSAKLKDKAAFWLCASWRSDVSGYPYDFHAPIHESAAAEQRAIAAWMQIARDGELVIDALCVDGDAEYREIRWLAGSLSG